MSGGSYNYLTHAYGLEELLGKQDELDRMANRLEGLSEVEFPGSSAAGRLTRDLLVRLQLWEAHASVHADLLRGVWKDVEWWDSNDYGPNDVRDGLNELLSGKKT